MLHWWWGKRFLLSQGNVHFCYAFSPVSLQYKFSSRTWIFEFPRRACLNVYRVLMWVVAEHELIPGRALPIECHPEAHTDYAGTAVRWGLTYHLESAADCCQACLDHARNAKDDEKKCNIWVYCPEEGGCHSPDKYKHKHGECWLKQVSLSLFDQAFQSFRSCLIKYSGKDRFDSK